MSLDKLLAAINKGKVQPVYLLVGELYPQQQVVAALKDAVLDGEESDFNLDRINAAQAGVDAVLNAARTLGMFSPTRLVLARDMHKIKAPKLARILPYIDDPNPRACLVLQADKIDARIKLCARLKKAGGFFKFETLKEKQVPSWLTGEARRLKVKLAPGAAQRVADAVGTDMGQLSMALQQLSVYVGLDRAVRPEDVEELLAQTRERSIFELTNAVGKGQRRQAMLLLDNMLANREPGIRIVAMLARHVRQLWSVKALKAEHLPQKEIASRVGVHPYFLKDMARQAGRIDSATLQRMHRALFDADRALKSSKLTDAAIMQRLVFHLCPANRGPRRR